ncbi:hypothetical protein QUA46_28220 [Microcoleus sp. MON2_D6]
MSPLYRMVRSTKALPQPISHPIAPAAASQEPTTARTAIDKRISKVVPAT